MRYICYTIISILAVVWIAQAASISGTNVAAPVVPFTDSDTYPSHDAQYGKGGMMQFAYSSALRTIPETRRMRGMLVYTDDTKQVYQLYSTPGHNWRLFTVSGGGGSGGAVSSVFGRTGAVQPVQADYSTHYAPRLGTFTGQQTASEYACTRKFEVKDAAGSINYYVQANGRTVIGTPMTGFPNISSVWPRNGATNVARNAFILYYFDRDMEPTTINDENAVMDHGITGAVTYDSTKREGMFSTFRNLTTNTLYQVTVTTGTRDIDCNPMQSSKVWSFTTTSTP